MPELPYYALAQKYGKQDGVDPNLVESIIQTESGGRDVRNSIGASGPMQIMPATGAGLAKAYHETNPNLMDPEENIKLGTLYISELLRQFRGNRDDAIAGYNAGGGAVARYGGIPPYAETENYVRKVESALHDLGDTSASGYKAAGINWDDAVKSPAHALAASVSPFGSVTETFLTGAAQALKACQPWEKLWDFMRKNDL